MKIKPKYRINLGKNVFRKDSVFCLGEQLVEILKFVENILPPHIWYLANLDAEYKIGKIRNYESFSLKKFGSISSLEKLAQSTDQFLSGVFLAIKKGVEIEDDFFEADTEDFQFESRPIEGVIIEVRAFDTNFFQIFGEDHKIMRKIADHFITNIEMDES